MTIEKEAPFLLTPNTLVLGEYVIDRTIGRGTFGTVKLGYHLKTGRPIAIKIVHKAKNKKNQPPTDVQAERLYREVCLQRMISHSHPHIVRLYEVKDTSNYLFLFVELCSGGELFDYIIKRRRLGENEARTFYQDIISGLVFCHEHRVAHRDLKPENILLDGKRVKIADFGLSNFDTHGFSLSTYCGSPNYAAPEIVAGQPYSGHEIDVWSSGIILYAMVCGYLPFDDPHLAILFDRIKESTVKMPGFLSEALVDLLNQLLQAQSHNRITIRQIRDHAWFSVGLPTSLYNQFAYRGAPPWHSFVRRRFLLRRYGLPDFLDEEVEALIGVQRTRPWEEPPAWRRAADPQVTDRKVIEEDQFSDLTEEDRILIETVHLDCPHLKSSLIASLRRLGYGLPFPLRNISGMLMPDVDPTPETVAYHILDHKLQEGSGAIPLKSAAMLGFAHHVFHASNYPLQLTARMRAVALSNRQALMAVERSGEVFSVSSQRGVYSDLWRLPTPSSNSDSDPKPPSCFSVATASIPSSGTTASRAVRNLPPISLYEVDWKSATPAFPKVWQRRAMMLNVFQSDMARIYNKVLGRSRRKNREPFRRLMLKSVINKDLDVKGYVECIRSNSFHVDHRFLQSVVMAVLKSLGYSWTVPVYGKYLISTKTQQAEQARRATDASDKRTELSKAVDIGPQLKEVSEVRAELPTSIQLVAVVRVEKSAWCVGDDEHNENERHLITVCHIQGRVMESLHVGKRLLSVIKELMWSLPSHPEPLGADPPD